MLSKLDDAVSQFMWEDGNWRNTLRLKFNHHKNYMMSCVQYFLAEMMGFVVKAAWFVVHGVLYAMYFALGFTCVMWVMFIIHLCFNRLMAVSYTHLTLPTILLV